ncbi:MAG: endolytic transglycosylase MltG [Balneolia bacterium]|nr:endolytic transglycosylase MltG [Balneolia bacterium]
MPNKLFIASLITLFTAFFLLTYITRDHRLNKDTGFVPSEGDSAVLLIYEAMDIVEFIAALSPTVSPEITATAQEPEPPSLGPSLSPSPLASPQPDQPDTTIPPSPSLPLTPSIAESPEPETTLLVTSTPQILFNPDHLLWASDQLNIRSVRPGRYVINEGESYASLLGRMLRGEEDAGRIVIQPGQTYERFFNRVPTQFRFGSDELRAVMTDSAWIRDELGIEPHLLFGRMIANTYEMFWTTTPEAFVRRMLTEFDRAMSPYMEQIESGSVGRNFTLDEIITLASIVELEARYDSEKPRIAGLYLNRLNRPMRLQADPTVAYALNRRGRLTVRDYRVNHPYNTYRINGLPPGPITNPAISSIRAVIEPEENDYIFMVANPEGYHNFSRTYAEHQREVARWRSWLREQDALARERAAAEEAQRQLTD